jgi:hypothetical protein
MLKRPRNLLAIAVLIALAGCGGSDKITDESLLGGTGTGGNDGSGNTMCPVMGQDVTITYINLTMGVAVDFTTVNAQKLEALRMCMSMMAELHGGDEGDPGEGGRHDGHHSADRLQSNGDGDDAGMMGSCMDGGMMDDAHGGMMDGQHDSTTCHVMCQMIMSMDGVMGGMHDHFAGAAVAHSEIERGARLEFTTTDPASVEMVRRKVGEHFGAMRQGNCPMMRH